MVVHEVAERLKTFLEKTLIKWIIFKGAIIKDPEKNI